MAEPKPHTEIYQVSPLVVAVSVLAALLLETSPLRARLGFLQWFDFLLLVVVYFAISRRNPSTGLLLGLAVGLLEDALSHRDLGTYGMSKCLVGFAASSLTGRIDTDRPQTRLLLVFGFYHLHQFIFAGIQRLLLGAPAAFVSLEVLFGALVNALLAVLVFFGLDRFRQAT